MKFVVIGKKKVDYFSKSKNAQVVGVELYLLSAEEIQGGEGYSCLRPIYFNSTKHSYDDFQLDDVVHVYYNQYGNVEDVLKV